jgi:hypothetical protein
MRALGVPSDVSEMCLNHKLPGIEGIYNVHTYLEERKEALTRWALPSRYRSRTRSQGARIAVPRARPRSIAVWLRKCQLNRFKGLSGRLSGLSGIWPTGIRFEDANLALAHANHTIPSTHRHDEIEVKKAVNLKHKRLGLPQEP